MNIHKNIQNTFGFLCVSRGHPKFDTLGSVDNSVIHTATWMLYHAKVLKYDTHGCVDDLIDKSVSI